jgi:diadenylate cyclase
MIRILLITGVRSNLLTSCLSGQMEVDLMQTDTIERGRSLLDRHPCDLILAPSPGTSGLPEPSYMASVCSWSHDISTAGTPIPFLGYVIVDNAVIITDMSAGVYLLDTHPGLTRTLTTTLRQAAGRNRIERSFRSGYDLLTRVIAHMPLAYLRVDADRIEGVNGALESLAGKHRDELIGTAISDLLRPGLEQGDVWYQASLQTGTGNWVPVRVFEPALDESDSLQTRVLVLEDRREIEELITNLRETERTCREKLWLSEALVLKMSPDGLITFANNAALRCFGYQGQGLEGYHISLLLPSSCHETPDSPVNLFLGVANESEPTAIHIMEHLHNTGGKVYVAWATRGYYTSSGELAGLLCVGTNMTDTTPEGEGRISTRIWRDRVLEGTDILPGVFDAILQACLEIAREGREGRHVGTTFLVGDCDAVMQRSRQLILNPFYGHPAELRMVIAKDVREMLKEYALLDGAFVVSGGGLLEAAGRYITVDSSQTSLPKGLGTRHSSTAAITSVTCTVGLVVSESGGRVSVIKDGKIVKVIG